MGTRGRVTEQAFDPSALARMGNSIGKVETCSFMDAFSFILDARLARIDRVHPQEDLQEWRSAVIGLGASADMVGAQRIEGTCSDLLATDPSDIYAPNNLKANLRADGRVFTMALTLFNSS